MINFNCVKRIHPRNSFTWLFCSTKQKKLHFFCSKTSQNCYFCSFFQLLIFNRCSFFPFCFWFVVAEVQALFLLCHLCAYKTKRKTQKKEEWSAQDNSAVSHSLEKKNVVHQQECWKWECYCLFYKRCFEMRKINKLLFRPFVDCNPRLLTLGRKDNVFLLNFSVFLWRVHGKKGP